MFRKILKILIIIFLTFLSAALIMGLICLLYFLQPIGNLYWEFLGGENGGWDVIGNISSVITALGAITLIAAFIDFILNIQKKELSIFPYNNKSFIIWNSGSEPIFRRDIANKKLLGVTIKNDTAIKDIDVLEVENSPMELEKKLDPRDPNRIVFDFDFIDKGQGFVVKIPYDNIPSEKFDCKVIGGCFQDMLPFLSIHKIETAFDRKKFFSFISKISSALDIIQYTCFGVVVICQIILTIYIPFINYLLENQPFFQGFFEANHELTELGHLSPIKFFVIVFVVVIIIFLLFERHCRVRIIPKELISLVEQEQKITLRMRLKQQFKQ